MSAPGPTGTLGFRRLLRRSQPEEALFSEARHSHDQVGDGGLTRRVPLPAQHAADVF